MKKQNAMRWVKALRSGKYKQGKGALERKSLTTKEMEYCCLGVLCKINPIHETLEGHGFPEDVWLPKIDLKSCRGDLPKYYKGKNGIECDSLFRLNDNGLSFKQIANIIEKNWEAL